jgi:hypothetical protein
VILLSSQIVNLVVEKRSQFAFVLVVLRHATLFLINTKKKKIGIPYVLAFTMACDLEDLDATSVVRKNRRNHGKSRTSFRSFYWWAHSFEERGEK